MFSQIAKMNKMQNSLFHWNLANAISAKGIQRALLAPEISSSNPNTGSGQNNNSIWRLATKI